MKIESILMPTDFSESSDSALEFASSLAAETGAQLHILHVADNTSAYLAGYGDFPIVADVSQEVEQQNRALLDQVTPTVAGLDCRRHYLTGSAASTIVEFAEKENMALIVMGTHGRSGISRLLLGSVAEGVLRHAPCPVLTVKQPSQEKASADDAEEVDRPDRS